MARRPNRQPAARRLGRGLRLRPRPVGRRRRPFDPHRPRPRLFATMAPSLWATAGVPMSPPASARRRWRQRRRTWRSVPYWKTRAGCCSSKPPMVFTNCRRAADWVRRATPKASRAVSPPRRSTPSSGSCSPSGTTRRRRRARMSIIAARSTRPLPATARSGSSTSIASRNSGSPIRRYGRCLPAMPANASEDAFGVYVGNEIEGEVQPLARPAAQPAIRGRQA